MAHRQKPHFVFRLIERVHLNRWGRQFSRLLAAEVCVSAWVMLDRPRSEVAWEYWLPTPIRQFPLHFPSLASPCATRLRTSCTSEMWLVKNQKPSVCWGEAAPGKHWFVRSQIQGSKSLISYDAKKWTPEINTALCINARKHRAETNGFICMNVYTFLLLTLIWRKNSIPSKCDGCCRQQKVIQFARESPQSSLWRANLVPPAKWSFCAWSYCTSLGLSNCKPS